MWALRAVMRDPHLLPAGVFLSVNATPAALGPLAKLLAGLGDRRPAHLVVEVTEAARIPDYQALDRVLAHLRDMQVRVAVDDAGAGYASFRHILRLSPEFIKLDVTL